MSGAIETDVAIVGCGPAGSTLASILRKYRPALRVDLFERTAFPREHVGESLLPLVCSVLDEMGCWDAVERAGFPVKIGATYRWGTTPDLWDFEFLGGAPFSQQARPGRYEGQRRETAFQVERALFDSILLDNAKERGTHVHQPRRVDRVLREGDRVAGLVLDDGGTVHARHYVDASGGTGVLRRAMGVAVEEPTQLQNVAFWDYWEDAEWAVTIGTTATRVLVMSLPYGWLWFIPVGPTRTSIGLVVPAKRYKEMGLSPEELYLRAMAEEPKIRELTESATREGNVRGTKDWSFRAERLVGENWYLAGESAGFADPILAAGITLAMTGARELAYTILEIERGKLDAPWLKATYGATQLARIGQHIQFADFWYSANGQFSDLKEFTRGIARDAGLELDANQAFQWLGTGGFAHDAEAAAGVAEFSVALLKQLVQRLTDTKADWAVNHFNVFRLNLEGATLTRAARYRAGGVERTDAYVRGDKTWPLRDLFSLVFQVLQREKTVEGIVGRLHAHARSTGTDPGRLLENAIEVLEALVHEGWVVGKFDPKHKPLTAVTNANAGAVRDNADIPPARRAAAE
ncbi:hypothetical protein BH11ARM2_BH11ARM2_18770 [soil metagenome]